MAKSVVSIAKGTDPEKMIEEALNLLGGVTSLIKPGSTVVIKPNIIGMYPAERSITTSPPFVAAAIKVLRKANPKQIILAESSAMRRDTDKCLDISGIRAAAEKAGVDKIVDIKKEQDLIKLPIRDHRSDLTSILMPRFMVEAEHIVNLPIYKCHVSAVFSCCMKNIKGTVQDKVHYQMHQTDLAAAMMDVWSVLRMDLNIVDMINPLEGFGPLGGIPHTGFGCVIAGKDPVATDATACRMVGLPVEKAPFFPYAQERGLGIYDEKDIEIRGKKIKEVFKQLWIPYLTGGWEQWPEYKIINEGACSSCQGLLAYGLERLKSLDAYDKNAGMTVCLGRIKEVPKGVKKEDLILMGDCIPKKLRDQGLFVEGCPPLEFQPTWTMIDKKYEPPGVYTRNYMDEIAKFFEYSKKVRDQWAEEQAKKAAPKAKGKAKK